MKWSSAFRISKKTLKSSALIWCILLSAIAVYWLIISSDLWLDLSRQKASEVIVTAAGTVSDAVINEASEIEGVEVISKKQTFGGSLLYGEYSQPILICGVSAEYMSCISGLPASDFNGAMPYVLMDKAAASGFVNEEKESLEISDSSEFLMETVKLGGEVPIDFRVAGIVTAENDDHAETSEPEPQSYSYGTESGGSLYISADWFEKLWPADEESDMSGEILIRLKSGRFIEDAGKSFEKLEIYLTEDYTQKWNEAETLASDALYKGALAAACVFLVGYYEFKYFRLKHKAAIEYMRWLADNKRLTKIWVCRYSVAVIAAALAGFAYWGFRTIFFQQTL